MPKTKNSLFDPFWAISPESLEKLQSLISQNASHHEAFFMFDDNEIDIPRYEVINGVAVLNVNGVMTRSPDFWTYWGFGTSTEEAAKQLKKAEADPSVHDVVIIWDTPGGTVDGTSEFARTIASVAENMPVHSVVTGGMLSAGYWAGSASSHIYLSSETSLVGSIGVVHTHADVSKRDEKWGVKYTEITAGKYKRIASSHQPLTEEGRASIQDEVDYLYSIFVSAVAKHRNTDDNTVLQNMADGKVYIGQQAIDAGLVDGFKTKEELVGELTNGTGHNSYSRHRADNSNQPNEVNRMGDITKESIEAEHPEIAAALRAEGEQTGATNELKRIQDVMAQAMPGHDALVQKLAFDGKTTGPQAAVQILGAERQKLAAVADNLDDDAPTPAKTQVNTDEEEETPSTVSAKEIADRANALVTKAKAEGRTLSVSQAVREVRASLEAE